MGAAASDAITRKEEVAPKVFIKVAPVYTVWCNPSAFAGADMQHMIIMHVYIAEDVMY